MTPTSFSVSGQRVVVVGAARSGIAAAELLARRGAQVTLADTREQIEGASALRQAGITLALGPHGPGTFSAAQLIVLSPGVSPRQPDVAAAHGAGIPVIAEIELASRWLRGRIVAITGTKGKSTTTMLTGRMLEAGGHRVLVGGNIGHALSAQVDESTEHTIHVVETSSFQLETIDAFRPWVAVLLNLSPDHLDRHLDFADYSAAKERIFSNQTAADWAVLNADDAASLALAASARAQRLMFGAADTIADGVTISNGAIVRRSGGRERPLVPLASIQLLGRHLLADVMAAAAVATIAGVDGGAMTRAVAAFHGLEHALEVVATVEGVRFVNDTKATNIESALRSIETFEPRLVVIMGGRFKGGDFADLRDALVARRAAVVAIGEAAPLIHAALDSSLRVADAADMRTAVRTATALAGPGDTVLLAPACSSFDLFRDYAERGRAFKTEVAKLSEEVEFKGQRNEEGERGGSGAGGPRD